jgi:hypothetical protein
MDDFAGGKWRCTHRTTQESVTPVTRLHKSVFVLQRFLCKAITEEEYLEARVEVALAPLRRWLTPDRIDSIRKTMSEFLAFDPVVGELIRNLAKGAGAAQNQCAIRSLDAENAENNSQEFFTTAPPVQNNSSELFATVPPVQISSQELSATVPPVQISSQELSTTVPPVQNNSQELSATVPPVQISSPELFSAISGSWRGKRLQIADVGHNTTGLEIVQTQMVGCWDSVSKSNQGG